MFYGCACDGLVPSLMPMRNGWWGSLRTREGSTGMKNSVPKTISFNPRTYKGVAVCPAAFGNRYRKRPGGCVRQREKTLIVRGARHGLFLLSRFRQTAISPDEVQPAFSLLFMTAMAVIAKRNVTAYQRRAVYCRILEKNVQGALSECSGSGFARYGPHRGKRFL